MIKLPRKHANITHTALVIPTEKQKAVKEIRKQLLVGAAAIAITTIAAVGLTKVLDVDVTDN